MSRYFAGDVEVGDRITAGQVLPVQSGDKYVPVVVQRDQRVVVVRSADDPLRVTIGCSDYTFTLRRDATVKVAES